MDKVKGVIGISGGHLARFADTYDSILHLECPPGWFVVQAKGGSPAENRNGIAERAIQLGAESLLYLDDDQVFSPDTMSRLLAHDKDVVSALYLHRQPPYKPLVGEREDEDGHWYPRLLKTFDGGLKKVLTVAAGCLLVKTHIFEKLEKPWWRLGQIEKDKWCDDVDFCRRLRQAGVEIWCDLDTVCGHNMIGTLWPMKKLDGTWVTILVQEDKIIMEWPAAHSVGVLETVGT